MEGPRPRARERHDGRAAARPAGPRKRARRAEAVAGRNWLGAARVGAAALGVEAAASGWGVGRGRGAGAVRGRGVGSGSTSVGWSAKCRSRGAKAWRGRAAAAVRALAASLCPALPSNHCFLASEFDRGEAPGPRFTRVVVCPATAPELPPPPADYSWWPVHALLNGPDHAADARTRTRTNTAPYGTEASAAG